MIKSDSYYTRKELMKTLVMPTMSEIKEQLGNPLANVFFDQCATALAEDIGLTPGLEGPGELLWTSPSDLLIGKVVLKPPLTARYIKALTHEGILELGGDVEIKFLNEMEMDKQKALRDQERRLAAECDRKINQALINAKKDEQSEFEDKINSLKDEFNRYLDEQLSEMESKLVDEYQQMFEAEKERLEAQWQERLEEATEETVTNLTKKFLEDMNIKQKELTDYYEKQLRHQQVESNITIEEEQRRCKSTLRALQHNLECKNIANMMYVLCMERRKCESEREMIHKLYRDKVASLEKTLRDKNTDYNRMFKERRKMEQTLNIREELLCEVLKQFQKFINFALRAAPTQAEFLLDVEKMLTLELTKALLGVAPQRKRTKHLITKLKQWKDDYSTASILPAMDAKDHHECLNLVSPPPSTHSSISESELLPAIFYNKGMYIREDFRNMLSQGLTIGPDSLLWNKDVEHLIQIFKKVSKGSLMKDSLDEERPSVPKRTRSQQSGHSSVHFGRKDDQQLDDTVHKKIRSIMSTSQYTEEIVDKVQYGTEDSLGLLQARDSITKIRESIASHTRTPSTHSIRDQPEVISLSRSSHRKEPNGQQPGPSIIKEEERSEPEQQDINEEESEEPALSKNEKMPSQESKLTLVRDSVVLARVSLKHDVVIPAAPEELPVRKNSRISLTRDSIVLRKMSLGMDATPMPVLPPDSKRSTATPEEISKRPSSKPGTPRRRSRISSTMSTTKSYLDFLLGSQKSVNLATKSRLTMHQDSLELLKEKIRSSKSYAKADKPKDKPIAKPAHNDERMSVVTFKTLPKVYELEEYKPSDTPWKIYARPKHEEQDADVPEETAPTAAEIVGDVKAKEYLQTPKEFASTRINSMLNILGQNTELIKMFTGCTQ